MPISVQSYTMYNYVERRREGGGGCREKQREDVLFLLLADNGAHLSDRVMSLPVGRMRYASTSLPFPSSPSSSILPTPFPLRASRSEGGNQCSNDPSNVSFCLFPFHSNKKDFFWRFPFACPCLFLNWSDVLSTFSAIREVRCTFIYDSNKSIRHLFTSNICFHDFFTMWIRSKLVHVQELSKLIA